MLPRGKYAYCFHYFRHIYFHGTAFGARSARGAKVRGFGIENHFLLVQLDEPDKPGWGFFYKLPNRAPGGTLAALVALVNDRRGGACGGARAVL